MITQTFDCYVPIAILIGELYAFMTACRFYRLHKRLFPEDKGERRLETFFNAFFPWHTMRAADLIIRKNPPIGIRSFVS